MRPTSSDRTCGRCGDPDPLPLGHHCWDEKRARAAVIRAVRYFTEDPDRCDMQGYEDQVADEVLTRLKGDDLVPGRFAAERRNPP